MKKKVDSKSDAFIAVRVPVKMKLSLQEKADYYGRTLSDYIKRLFVKNLK